MKEVFLQRYGDPSAVDDMIEELLARYGSEEHTDMDELEEKQVEDALFCDGHSMDTTELNLQQRTDEVTDSLLTSDVYDSRKTVRPRLSMASLIY